jgi:DNA-binding NtrC family response regulator
VTPGSSPASGSIRGSTSQVAKDALPRVLVSDADATRVTRVIEVVCACDALAMRFENERQVRQLIRAAACHTAIVGGTAPDDESLLELTRTLKTAGYTVIGYCADLARWPVGAQCRALLAGCSQLLDCSTPGFADALRETLAQRLAEGDERIRRATELRASMLDQGIVGGSPALLDTYRLVRRIASLSDLPALVTGESGTGKELIARAIHRLDERRARGPFIAVNCGAIAHELAESELFGHRSGAFTGAARDRKGLFRAADGGVLFLDEVGELDERLQAKLLRVLQENRVLGVGEEVETPVDVRVVAATNADLRARVRDKRFREDLFNRLNALAVHLPPLRERTGDVRLLASHFLHRFALLRGESPLTATPEFLDALDALPLRGNARELENLLRWTVIHKADDEPLSLRDLPPEVWEQLSGKESSATSVAVATQMSASNHTDLAQLLEAKDWNIGEAIADCERRMLDVALARENGNQSRAAKLLGITARSVYNKLHRRTAEPEAESLATSPKTRR